MPPSRRQGCCRGVEAAVEVLKLLSRCNAAIEVLRRLSTPLSKCQGRRRGVEAAIEVLRLLSRREATVEAFIEGGLDSCINLKNTGLDLAAALTKVFPCLIELVQLRFFFESCFLLDSCN
jgi:hypothetical protein